MVNRNKSLNECHFVIFITFTIFCIIFKHIKFKYQFINNFQERYSMILIFLEIENRFSVTTCIPLNHFYNNKRLSNQIHIHYQLPQRCRYLLDLLLRLKY